MLCWILIVGGLLIMMGQHDRTEALFYYFRLEDQIPETHLLRLIEKHVSFAFVREKLKDSYSETGRPSIDPELLLRILLIGYLYGITSERKLPAEIKVCLFGSSSSWQRLRKTSSDWSASSAKEQNRRWLRHNCNLTEKRSPQLQHSRPRQHSFPTRLFQHPQAFTPKTLCTNNLSFVTMLETKIQSQKIKKLQTLGRNRITL